MKAVVYRGKDDLRLEEIPIPKPGAGEMLVRVDACGICPTDLKKVEKGLLPGPRVFGHEIAGTVVALGAGTRGPGEGQRVVVITTSLARRASIASGRSSRSAPDTSRTAPRRASRRPGAGMPST